MIEVEELDVVDDADRVLARASRARIHDEYLIHRSVMFFVLDEEDGVFVNQRSALKPMYPSFWSIAFGGHVQAGETYEEAVAREVEEETGLRDRVFSITSFQKRTADERENVKVYGVRAREELRLFADEIEQGRFVTMAELNEMLGHFDFLPETPTLLKTLTEYTARRL
ncbi:MAG TPA: NUDIX domain-containing protein [Dehalococcoidia bacterium]|nr:NUDIX domain-containing protein [Dehalococcoidia bacterium]